MVVSVVKGVSPCVLYVDVNRFYLVMSWLYKRITFVVVDSRDGSLYIPCTRTLARRARVGWHGPGSMPASTVGIGATVRCTTCAAARPAWVSGGSACVGGRSAWAAAKWVVRCVRAVAGP